MFYFILTYKKLAMGFETKDTIIPIVPASGGENPMIYRNIHEKSPNSDENIAPNLFTFLEKSPHTKDPRKTDPIAPHEIERTATIVSMFSKARITDNRTKNPFMTLIRTVRFLSEIFGLINPS